MSVEQEIAKDECAVVTYEHGYGYSFSGRRIWTRGTISRATMAIVCSFHASRERNCAAIKVRIASMEIDDVLFECISALAPDALFIAHSRVALVPKSFTAFLTQTAKRLVLNYVTVPEISYFGSDPIFLHMSEHMPGKPVDTQTICVDGFTVDARRAKDLAAAIYHSTHVTSVCFSLGPGVDVIPLAVAAFRNRAAPMIGIRGDGDSQYIYDRALTFFRGVFVLHECLLKTRIPRPPIFNFLNNDGDHAAMWRVGGFLL